MRLTTSPLAVADTSIVTLSNGLYFYALGVDPVAGDLYVSKVVGSGGSGQVEIYTPSGALKRAPLEVGLFPGSFAFKP